MSANDICDGLLRRVAARVERTSAACWRIAPAPEVEMPLLVWSDEESWLRFAVPLGAEWEPAESWSTLEGAAALRWPYKYVLLPAERGHSPRERLALCADAALGVGLEGRIARLCAGFERGVARDSTTDDDVSPHAAAEIVAACRAAGWEAEERVEGVIAVSFGAAAALFRREPAWVASVPVAAAGGEVAPQVLRALGLLGLRISGRVFATRAAAAARDGRTQLSLEAGLDDPTDAVAVGDALAALQVAYELSRSEAAILARDVGAAETYLNWAPLPQGEASQTK